MLISTSTASNLVSIVVGTQQTVSELSAVYADKNYTITKSGNGNKSFILRTDGTLTTVSNSSYTLYENDIFITDGRNTVKFTLANA